MATEFFVVDLKVGQSAAHLASPAIAIQYLPMKLSTRFSIDSYTSFVYLLVAHEAVPATCSKNARCCGAGRNV